MATDRLHLTLAFMGAVDARQIAWLCAQADRIRVPRFTVVLDRLGWFRAPQILWLGMQQTPAPPQRLARTLRVLATSVDAPDRADFVPHVSIRRDASADIAGSVSPVCFVASAFTLTASGQGTNPGAYRHLARWPLQAVPGASPDEAPI